MKTEEFINSIEERDNFFREEDNYLASVWEEHLTSEYWKNWRGKIRNFQNEDEFIFFADRLLKLRTSILWTIRYYKGDRYDADYIRKLVDINEEKLQNISEEDFKKESKFADAEVRELTNKEIADMLEYSLNDSQKPKYFSKFDSKAEQVNSNSNIVIIVTISAFSALAIGGIILVAKSKLNKKVKK